MDIAELLKNNPSIAIIGASNNEEKYGYKIYKDMKDKGYEVVPVNHREDEIQGDRAYPTIRDLPKKVDILDFVVPPAISLEISKEAVELGYRVLWFQPGSSDESVLEYVNRVEGLTVIHDQCIMIESNPGR